jgi:predicted nuclease of predicted toxin-antitoxin system
MQFKVDENLHEDVAVLIQQHGHDALTVYDQGLRGHSDGEIAAVCRREARANITLDLDFSDIRDYPPQNYAGIVVLRLVDSSRKVVARILARVMPLFDSEPLTGHLWIVDEHHVRIRGVG